MKFIGLYGTVGFNAIRDFSLWGESDLWSDVWLAMDVVVCLSILLEGGVTVSNNFTKRRQNGFKIGTRDKFATHLRKENFISIEIFYLHNFFYDSWFSHTILYIHKLSHTSRILSLGSLWLNMTISPALFPAVTVTVFRDSKIRIALRTSQIAGFVTVPR